MLSLSKHGAGFFNGRLTAVGNARIASRAAGWKIAGFTAGASQIWDIPSSLAVSMASLLQDGIIGMLLHQTRPTPGNYPLTSGVHGVVVTSESSNLRPVWLSTRLEGRPWKTAMEVGMLRPRNFVVMGATAG